MKPDFAKLSLLFLFLAALLLGCVPATDISPTLVPMFSLPAETETAPPVNANSIVVIDGSAVAAGPALPTDAAVILVGQGERLNLRAAAGVENPVVAEVAANATGLFRTGRTQFSGEDLWAEVRASTGETGWVNARYLTEYVPAEKFCADSQIQLLLDNLLIALESKNGELFASLVSPVHGLDLRYFRYGALANYSPAEATWVFQSSYEVVWGYAGGSGAEVKGAFSEAPLPMLLGVLQSEYELHCNDVGVTAAFAQEPWLPEYANINFYNVFKPATDQYGGLDWRAWLVGVEYVGGKPYLFALIHFEWEP